MMMSRRLTCRVARGPGCPGGTEQTGSRSAGTLPGAPGCCLHLSCAAGGARAAQSCPPASSCLHQAKAGQSRSAACGGRRGPCSPSEAHTGRCCRAAVLVWAAAHPEEAWRRLWSAGPRPADQPVLIRRPLWTALRRCVTIVAAGAPPSAGVRRVGGSAGGLPGCRPPGAPRGRAGFWRQPYTAGLATPGLAPRRALGPGAFLGPAPRPGPPHRLALGWASPPSCHWPSKVGQSWRQLSQRLLN